MEEPKNKPTVVIKDLTGIGKVLPINKLVDIFANSVGRIFKSYFDREDADTEAYKIEKVAEARAKEIAIITTAVKDNFKQTGGIKYEENKIIINSPSELSSMAHQALFATATVEERAENRINFQESKKQLNIERVAGYAAEELRDEQPVTEEPVDEDWTTRFFRIVEDVSNEEMQALWGKVLAGEIKQPGSYSIRTIELIRNLSKIEAETFLKVAQFAVRFGLVYYIFKGNNIKRLDDSFGIPYINFATLIEAGLIQTGVTLEQQFSSEIEDKQTQFLAGDTIIYMNIKANTPKFGMPLYAFTRAGNELLNLNKPNPPVNYIKYIVDSTKTENITFKYATIISLEGLTIHHTLPLQEF